MANTHDAIVIGGGHNGLIAGAYRSRAGARTVVLEARNKTGGAADTSAPFKDHPDINVTTYSYVMSLMPPTILRDLSLEKHGYKVYPMGPYYQAFPDGRAIKLYADDAKKNYESVGEFSKKIIAAGGAKCGFTTSWPSWTMLENTFPWHDQPFATNANGYTGLDTTLLINGEFGVKHIGQLAAWQKEGVFSYGGRMGQPDPKFINGDCAMLVQSSAVIGGFKKSLKFEWGTGQLPHWGPPYRKQNTVVGGATLWVMKGQKASDYPGVARFMKFLAEPHQQMWRHVTTGYLPITHSAIKNLETGHHFKKNPEQWTALSQLTAKPTPNSLGHRLGNFVQIREAIEGELENIFAGTKTAKQGLDDAVAKGNEILKEFAASNKP